MLKKFTTAIIFLLALSAFALSQKPFYTDDADVTEKNKFHFEFANRYDLLQRSAYPIEKQNAASFLFAYGLLENIEISVETPVITLIGEPSGGFAPRRVAGIGDTNFGVKYNFWKEREDSRMPALSVSANLEIPTGNAERQLGSGIADFGVNFIAQKTFKEKNVFRVNAGTVFSGNTITGVEGIAARGTVFSGGTSLVRDFTEKLKLGVEITGAVTNNFQLSKGQLQFQFGGNYRIRKNATLDFGVITGRYAASPRLGGQIGVSIDF